LNFSEKVKEAMKQKSINGSELARRMGHSPNYILNLLKNDRRWNEDLMNKACEVLNIKVKFE
jgi:transcriptional regulator with XRE-family HTH domain